MATNFVERRRELSNGFRTLRKANPGVMSGFGKMHGVAMADGELSAKTKELIALAVSITSLCEGCISFHVHDAIVAGATDAEIEEAVGVAVFMGGGPAAVYGSDALEALRQFSEDKADL